MTIWANTLHSLQATWSFRNPTLPYPTLPYPTLTLLPLPYPTPPQQAFSNQDLKYLADIEKQLAI